MTDNYLTVGHLRKAIENLPDDAPVYYQRIEDVYFQTHGWKTEDRQSLDHPNQTTSYIRAYWAGTRLERALFLDAHY